MDNRWRFLYYKVTELWGRRRKARPGNGKPRASEGGAMEGKPYGRPKSVKRTEERVRKRASQLPRKAAIVYLVPVPKTDTGG